MEASVELVVDTRSSSATSLSLTITKSFPSPVVSEVKTSFEPPLTVPVSIILAVTPKLSSEALIALRKSSNESPAVKSIVKESLVASILKVRLAVPALSTEAEELAKPPSTASAVSIRLPLASCVTAIL